MYANPVTHTRNMTFARRIATVAAVALALCALPTAAQADESMLRERAHARVAIIMEDAVAADIYSASQEAYVTGAILPAYIDPKALPNRVEERTLDQFWQGVADAADLSVSQVQSRLRSGWTLSRLLGANAEDVRDDLSTWLSKPALQAYFEKRLTFGEFTELRTDIERAVWRIMAQPGGGRDVILVPRRN